MTLQQQERINQGFRRGVSLVQLQCRATKNAPLPIINWATQYVIIIRQALAEGVTRCLYASLYLPWAKKLSLAKKIKLPNIKSSPAQQELLEIVLEVKKKKKPPIVNNTKIVPQRSRTYLMGSVPVRLLLRVLMLKNEKRTNTSQTMIQSGQILSTYSIDTLFYARSSAMQTKAVTQKICPIRKLSAPRAKNMKLSPQRRNMSPADPNNSPIIMVVMWR